MNIKHKCIKISRWLNKYKIYNLPMYDNNYFLYFAILFKNCTILISLFK